MIKVGGVKRKQEGSTVNRALETYVNGKAAVNNSEERAARAPKDALIRIFGVVISSKRVSLFFLAGWMDCETGEDATEVEIVKMPLSWKN